MLVSCCHRVAFVHNRTGKAKSTIGTIFARYSHTFALHSHCGRITSYCLLTATGLFRIVTNFNQNRSQVRTKFDFSNSCCHLLSNSGQCDRGIGEKHASLGREENHQIKHPGSSRTLTPFHTKIVNLRVRVKDTCN